jgi:hypothetical protein
VHGASHSYVIEIEVDYQLEAMLWPQQNDETAAAGHRPVKASWLG